ncbi:MAG TPA: lactate racemase domain-containing protein [Gemmataceae bacterium]|nr:lactate racemase domain-containing protein [Gemmataceae bacterium]
MDLPLITRVHQKLSRPALADVPGETRNAWGASSLARHIKRRSRVAVAVGSRGIANIADITKATLEYFRDLGAQPFVVAAMGSHGGGTSEGQRQLLGEYGISEQALGVPVKTDMTAKVIGQNSWNEPVFWDANALEADAVVTISRIKPHTDFRGRYESGIVKMMVIGLGKRDGAATHHRYGFRGLRDMLPETAKVILEKTPFLGGLAVLENAHEQTALLKVLDRTHVLDEEPELLNQARTIMGRLPFDQLDLLVICEIGKNYSGAGIDPNVVGRLFIEGEPDFEKPKITRICALDLSPESHGNGTGCGLADLTTDRLLAAIDPVPFRMNNLTACFLLRSKLPFSFPTDRECITSGLETCWQPQWDKIRMAIIPNTLELADLWISPALLEETCANSNLEVRGEARPMPFDAKENLLQDRLFPVSVRGKRHG